jgi:Na+-transporting NADH:ubiquinone oxidoreductase subunit NqrB
MATHTDPRLYQIVVLGGLLAYGLIWLDLGVTWEQIALVLAACLATQYVCTRAWKLPRYDPRSALISALSLSLLLRVGHPALAILASVVTISSKFLIRVDNRHVFNPTNFGLVVTMILADQVWVSPGQWGSIAFFGFLLASLGVVVVNRAARSDVTYAFLASYVSIVVGRTVWLGDPASIAIHQLQNGGLVLFAFFMISDPKTTPTSRGGRVLFGLLVALGAAYMQFVLYRPNGLLWSLVASAAIVPMINRWLPGHLYMWPASRDAHTSIDASAPVTTA